MFLMLRSRRITGGLVFLASATAINCRQPSDLPGQKVSCENATERKIVIIGGGTAGVGVSAQLINQGIIDVTIIEPNPVHYYQPLWTLVGAGLKKKEDSMIPMRKMINEKVSLLPHSVKRIKPDTNEVELENGTLVSYDYLVVAAGIQTNWNAIPGLNETVGKEKSGVVSIYDYEHSEKTWESFENFKGGRALFTVPNTSIKCAGAPQKIMWLFEEYCCKNKLREKSTIEFYTNGTAMFGVKKYAEMLEKLRIERDVEVNYQKELIKINPKTKVATFKSLKDGSLSNEQFDLLHVTPPMSSPDFIKNSKISDKSGYVDVNKYTLQSVKYKNIFALGDCSNSPNSKTAAAIMAQAPVVVHNLEREMKGEELDGVYNGYGSCPLMVGLPESI